MSELVGATLSNLVLGAVPSLLVNGKGRKHRNFPLWKETASDLRAWLSVRGDARAPEIFVNAEGRAMTRSGFEYILDKHAAKGCAPLPFTGRAVDITTSTPTQLCRDHAGSNPRYPEGCTLARSCGHTDHWKSISGLTRLRSSKLSRRSYRSELRRGKFQGSRCTDRDADSGESSPDALSEQPNYAERIGQ